MANVGPAQAPSNYIFYFRLMQEAEQKALILLCDMACIQPSAIARVLK